MEAYILWSMLITVEEAARRLGVTPRRVYALITAGRLPARKFGTNYQIREGNLKRVEYRPTGRPPGKSKKKMRRAA